jgi:hypothetical protein
MKYLTLILLLATGEIDRHVTPAWECRTIQAEYEKALAHGGSMARDDGVKVLEIKCEAPTFVDLLTLSSDGPCEEEA